MSVTCRIIGTRTNLTHWRECIDLRAQLQIVYNIEYRDYSANHKRIGLERRQENPPAVLSRSECRRLHDACRITLQQRLGRCHCIEPITKSESA